MSYPRTSHTGIEQQHADGPLPDIQLRPYQRSESLSSRLGGTVIMVVTMALAYPAANDHTTEFWIACLVSLFGVGISTVVPWARTPRWTETIPPLLTLLGITVLVQAAGGLGGGFSIMLIPPLVWFAAYGNVREVLLGLGVLGTLLLSPILQLIFPTLPDPAPLGVTAVTLLIMCMIIVLLYRLVQIQLQQVEIARNAIETLDLSHQAMSHDLRGPLGMAKSVTGDAIGVLEDNPKLAAQMLEIVERLIGSSISLVSGVMMLHQPIETHSFESINPADVIQNAGAGLKELTITVSDMPTTVFANPNVLERAFRNLFENAIRYSNDAANPPTVTVNASRVDEQTWQFNVADNGPGILDADLPYIFEPFRRGSALDGIDGTGLGLAIVQACAKAHGGEVKARNMPDGGACFSMTLKDAA